MENWKEFFEQICQKTKGKISFFTNNQKPPGWETGFYLEFPNGSRCGDFTLIDGRLTGPGCETTRETIFYRVIEGLSRTDLQFNKSVNKGSVVVFSAGYTGQLKIATILHMNWNRSVASVCWHPGVKDAMSIPINGSLAYVHHEVDYKVHGASEKVFLLEDSIIEIDGKEVSPEFRVIAKDPEHFFPYVEFLYEGKWQKVFDPSFVRRIKIRIKG